MIYCSNPKKQYLSYKDEIEAAIERVLSSGKYILDREVIKFEEELSKFIGVKHGIGVGSGTEALHVALEACGIGSGDEVITVSHTAVATAIGISLSGAKPVFVDIEPNFYCMDPQKIQKAISNKTKAIVPVHLYGCPVEMDLILKIAKENNLIVIEDCAQAHGAIYKNKRVGSFGDLSFFSFYPTKNLGALGDGGMILTNNLKLAKNCRLIRQYGWEKRYISFSKGWNSRLDEIQASVLRIKLNHLDNDNQRRKKIAKLYIEILKNTDIILPKEKKETSHVYHLFVIRTIKRDSLKKYLEKNNIYPNIQYPVPIHLQPLYSDISRIDKCKVTEEISNQILTLPIYPELTLENVEKVAGLIVKFINKLK